MESETFVVASAGDAKGHEPQETTVEPRVYEIVEAVIPDSQKVNEIYELVDTLLEYKEVLGRYAVLRLKGQHAPTPLRTPERPDIKFNALMRHDGTESAYRLCKVAGNKYLIETSGLRCKKTDNSQNIRMLPAEGAVIVLRKHNNITETL